MASSGQQRESLSYGVLPVDFNRSPCITLEAFAMQCTDSAIYNSRLMRALALFLLATFLSACASKSTRPPANLTPEHYVKTATITPRPDLDSIHLNTEKGFEEPYEDNRHYRGTYLLAAIDRKTGKAAIGVDFMQMTDTPRTKVIVTYEAPEGTMRQTIYVKSGHRQCRENDCRVLESISIPLKESLVRHYAKLYSPNLERHWSFKVGEDYSGEIAYAEMAGLIQRIDQARKSLSSITHPNE